jgi:uncharacterized protein (UPF0179 family)
MPLITLIGENLAKEGNEFIYIGPSNECKNCKLKTVCFNLKKGRHYRIEKIREKKHNCNIHEGKTSVIEVKELPITTNIDIKLTEGSISKIEPKECSKIQCDNYKICHNIAIKNEKKYKIKRIIEKVSCKMGYNLQKAEIED